MAMSARQMLRELTRRRDWLVKRSSELREQGRNPRANEQELEAMNFAIYLVEMKVEENAAKHEPPRERLSAQAVF